MISDQKQKLTPIINTIAKPFANINPNIITLFGLIPPILYLISMNKGLYGWSVVFIILVSTDFIDGAVARMSGKVTKFGGVLDSTIDRISDVIIISAFGFSGIVSWWLVILLITFSFSISYIRSRAELASNGKLKLDVGLMQRTERIVLLGICSFLLFLDATFISFSYNLVFFLFGVTTFLSFGTVVQRLLVSYRSLNS